MKIEACWPQTIILPEVYFVFSVLCLSLSTSVSTGGGVPLQETNQEEQGATVRHDVFGQEQGAQGLEQRAEGETGGLPAPLLPAPGERRATLTHTP